MIYPSGNSTIKIEDARTDIETQKSLLALSIQVKYCQVTTRGKKRKKKNLNCSSVAVQV